MSTPSLFRMSEVNAAGQETVTRIRYRASLAFMVSDSEINAALGTLY
jgi:hypothetical protein